MRKAMFVFLSILFLIGAVSDSPVQADASIRVLINENSLDPVLHDITGFYAEFARAMQECGATVDRASLYRITDAVLDGYDIVILPLPITLEDGDKEALRRFIRAGGGVLLMVWKNSPVSDPANVESFTADYGIRFGKEEGGDFHIIADVVQSSPLAGPESARKVYVFGSALQTFPAPGEAEGVLVVPNTGHFFGSVSIKASMLGKGRLVVIGDDSLFDIPYIRSFDGLAFTRNLTRYLASEPANPDYAIIAFKLDAKRVYPGDRVGVNMTIGNVGNAATPVAQVTFTLYTWDETTKTAGTAVKTLGKASLETTAAGAQRIISRTLKIPGATPAGYYVVCAAVDPGIASGDTNAVNNTRMSKRFPVR